MPTSLHLVTGATSGLGLEVARQLLAVRGNRLIAGARRPEAARGLRALAGEDRLAILPLDLASLASTAAFADTVIDRLRGGRLASLAANAGLQFVGPPRLTADGFDETVQVNWLGHALLIERLLEHLESGAPVVLTASGTHDPADRTARLFGFRGGLFTGADRVARGELDPAAPAKQQGMDRYATSKLCAILHVYALARRARPDGPRFIAFDPGLMPGTGLARDRGAVEQWAWSNLLPVMARLMPGASTAQRSGAAFAELLMGRALPHGSGMHVDFTLAERPSSRDSHRLDWQDELDLLARRIAGTAAPPARFPSDVNREARP
jgi:NAD(P)-dependent dehydrogenase (short-subunit alcohol dehydrogenase family)